MDRRELAPSGFGLRPEADPTVEKKWWRDAAPEDIAFEFGVEPNDEFMALLDDFRECVDSAKGTSFLRILFENELARSGLI